MQGKNSIDLPADLLLQKRVSQKLSQTIQLMQQDALWKPIAERSQAIDLIMKSSIPGLKELEKDAVNPLGKQNPITTRDNATCVRELTCADTFYIIWAQLHVFIFHLFSPIHAIESDTVKRIYKLSCEIIELITTIDGSRNIAEYGPTFVTKHLHVPAIAILRIARSHLEDQIDLKRGQNAYFAMIAYHRKHAVRHDDAFAKFSLILAQLWTSSQIFRTPSGDIDSLRVRGGGRLGVGVVYGCFWWWRQEFGGQVDVFDDNEGMYAVVVLMLHVLK